jgi:hypothetical protein
MQKRAIWLATAALIVIMTACSAPEPELTEAEEAERMARVLQQTDPVGQFPTVTREEILPTLEGLSVRSVGDAAGAVNAVQIFDRAARAISLTEDAALDPETTELREQLIERLKAKQVELFPAMRRSYAAHLSDAVAGAQANFRAVGSGNKTLRAASPNFGSQDVVMQAHQMVMAQATRFRFNRAEYVYSITGAYDYYTVNGADDDEIGG